METHHPKISITLAVLNVYFSELKNLRTFINDSVEPTDHANEELHETTEINRDGGESDSYREFLDTTYVGLRHGKCGVQNPRFQFVAPMMYMKEIIQQAHTRLFSTGNGKPNNVIALGYQRVSDNSRSNVGCNGVTNRFVNTIVTALQGPEWERLFQNIGTDPMLYLLTKTSVFVTLPNDCLCQMTGEPLIHLSTPPLPGPFAPSNSKPPLKKRKLGCLNEGEERPRKRLRLQRLSNRGATETARQSISRPTQRRTAVDVSFIRTRLFYSRPSRNPTSHNIIVGLSYNHVLNRLNPSYFRKPRVPPELYIDPDPREQAKKARHLSKYVFPLQYGFPNAFSHALHAHETLKQADFSNREKEIELVGNCKTPKRLRDILVLLEKMIWRHGKCGYKPLRDKVCPSKITNTGNKSMDSSVILEMVSENSIQLESQPHNIGLNVSIDSHGNSILARSVSQGRQRTEHKPRFVEFVCSYTEVFRYAMLITKLVIPKAFWGCTKNFNVIQHYVKEFVTGRRYETFNLHRVLQGFRTSECDWLIPPGSGMLKQTRVSVTDSLKRRELLEEFIFWYFDSFLLSLLKTNFYVTESSAFRNQILYFRHDDWEALCAPLVDRLSEKTFQEIERTEAEEILRQRKLGFSFVRLLPKETGVRPIVNLRRRNAKKGAFVGPELSINQILQTTFQILTYEKQRQPELLGASVFGPNEIYTKLKAFKSRLLQNSPNGVLPKLYFVKVDVQACFDTINQSKLLMILRDLISEDNYMIQKYGQITSASGKIKRTYVKKAYPDDEHPHFLTYARDLANVLRQTIFTDQVQYSFETKRGVLQLLEEHINENLVKIGNKYYRQVVGIPQGSVLSSLLCSFCYGDLEKRSFKFTEDPESMLLRLIDDYLLVTTSLPKAKKFLDMMNKGHPEYGCIISKEKTLTSFDYDIEIMNVTQPTQKHFPWCGLLINMQDLSVMADYSRYNGIRIEHSMTVDKGRRPGVAFAYKMMQLAKARSHMIYNDTDLNDERTINLNIYQNFLVTAMKMHQYILNWGISVEKSATFIHNTVRQVIQYGFTILRSKSCNGTSQTNRTNWNNRKYVVLWLGTHAFHTVLSMKATLYASTLLKYLAFELSLPKNRRLGKSLRSLVKEGLDGTKHMQF